MNAFFLLPRSYKTDFGVDPTHSLIFPRSMLGLWVEARPSHSQGRCSTLSHTRKQEGEEPTESAQEDRALGQDLNPSLPGFPNHSATSLGSAPKLL